MAYFVKWLCDNIDRLYYDIEYETEKGDYELDFLKERRSQYSGFYRVANAYKLIRIAGRLVYRFFKDIMKKDPNVEDLNPEQKALLKDLHDRMDKGCDIVALDTLEHLRLPSRFTPIQKAVVELFVHDTDRIIAESAEAYDDRYHKMFRHGEEIYFRGEKLVQYLSQKVSDVSTKQLSKELLNLNLLVSPYSEGQSAPLPASVAEILQEEGKPRYYCIDVANLIELIKSNYNSKDLQDSPIKELRYTPRIFIAKSSKKGKK